MEIYITHFQAQKILFKCGWKEHISFKMWKGTVRYWLLDMIVLPMNTEWQCLPAEDLYMTGPNQYFVIDGGDSHKA